jgi:hypothetical protein
MIVRLWPVADSHRCNPMSPNAGGFNPKSFIPKAVAAA